MEASMALKGRMSQTILNASFLALDISLVLYLGFPSRAGSVYSRHLQLHEVTQEIERSETSPLRSVTFEDSLILPIVQQPVGKPNYVSANNGEVTQFYSAAKYGNIGLLAHNFLSGKSFSHLTIGQRVRLGYADGKTENFIITEILRYQALQPKDPLSSFQNLNHKDEVLTVSEMFQRVYAGTHHITLQTCIAKNGISSWGRLFVVATPEAKSTSIVD
jgi:hypothetical protein